MMSSIASLEVVVVNVSPKTNWTFIAVTSDVGDVGWGECSLNAWEPLLVDYAHMLEHEARGCDLDDIEALASLVRYLPHSPAGLIAHAVKSALEQALTDLRARGATLPVRALLGAILHETIPAYANINRGVLNRTPDGFAAAACGAIDAGYRAVKLAPFDGVVAEDAGTTPIDSLINAGLERVFAVRAAIGPDVPLMVDCHWRFDEPRATQLLRDVAPAAPYWIECPISEHPSLFAAIERLRDRAHERGIRLAGGELIAGADQAKAMCKAKLYDVLMPDIKYAGGYRGMLSIAQICAAHDVAFSPHNPTGPIAHLASIQACAVAPALLWLEHQWAESALFDALIGAAAAPLIEGAFRLPAGPGLGAALNRQLAAAHPYLALPKTANLDQRLG